MDDQERQQALEDAVRDAVATHAQRLEAPRAAPPPRRETPLLAFIVLGWVVIAWIWLAQPAMIFGPTVTSEATVAEREARLRYAMYLQHHGIVAFTRDSGRVPSSLDELPTDPAAGVALEFDPQGGWALVGTDHDIALRLTQAMSPDSFLGASLATLRGEP